MLDPIMIGFVNIRLDDLINKGLCESWYSLEPTVSLNNTVNEHPANDFSENGNSSNEANVISNSCTVRIKLRFCEEKIYLNKSIYQELSDYLMNESEHRHLSTLYENIVPSTERQHLVQSLLRFYIVQNKIVEMLRSFLVAEIDRCADLSTLFRPASMSTSLMDHYMRVRCDLFLRKALEEPLVHILKQSTLNNGFSTSHSSNQVKENGQACKFT